MSALTHGYRLRPQIKFALCLALIVAALLTVKVTSIRTGPSADEAIAAIRMAQHEIVQARTTAVKENYPELTGADAEITLAWAALKEKRYEAAILAAHRAIALIRKRAA